MSELQELFDRWISTLRHKAATYEHPARGRGEEVTELSLDTVCNEMKAFLVGLERRDD